MLSMLLRLFCRDNKIQPETRPRQKAFCKAARRRWPWGRHRSVGKESSQAYTISEQEQRMKRLEKLKRDLERMKNERDELRGILAHYINKDLNKRFNFETTMLEMQHDQVMSELKNIPQQISEALYMCQELTKNNQLYSIRNCHLLTESLHMKSEVKMLWNENRQLLKEQITLDMCSKETRRLCVEASMKIYDKFSKHIQTTLDYWKNMVKTPSALSPVLPQCKVSAGLSIKKQRLQESDNKVSAQGNIIIKDLLHSDESPKYSTRSSNRAQYRSRSPSDTTLHQEH
ncbi:disks large homolog 5-like [Arvicanthis niloticus]|uniref:disks large homolog 5-like n=1 Tax=Arvicanthis niloticus TaxID=61156 RepID=UPI0014860135|nr:disks large homolog 5-like [Arvicanthis niloticus]